MTTTLEKQKKLNENETEYMLEAVNLAKHFPIKSGIFQRATGHIKAVDGISLFVNKGETLGIVGESGCGKSTAGRTFIRLYEPTEGKVLFKGRDISHLPESMLGRTVRKNIQMIFQDPYASMNPRKTLKSILSEPLITHHLYDRKGRDEKIAELLERVGFNPSFINRYPHEFSGGQRQRIGIARALALQPELIIADEAVSALDVSIQAQIINLMEDLQEEFGLTYIFISHDLSVVRHISDRVAVMYLGKIMEFARKKDLYEDPLHPYTKALLSAVPVPRKRGVEKRERIILKGDLPSPANPPAGCVFHTRCPAAMDVCKVVTPEFKEMKKEHYVACHLYQ
ncbi:ABC transporter ATP-binding protein [Siminovitchia fortis]|uniref:Dipeptide ABC transporter ATP-binding protein n=1 Tax=Siminovitchia fortis TaxID=254758 RepID=A0A451GCN6_9BACI|nr:dipeptide ABC transporter ATP-binding protein [Siminovitchia fortis]RWR13136.1 dipeptide ABC transporter ATP-binding protein [Siminovitchia fortis]WHY82081.1 dipeptide ABC transporter ATP-binding protein [Siminovitchia fortis]